MVGIERRDEAGDETVVIRPGQPGADLAIAEQPVLRVGFFFLVDAGPDAIRQGIAEHGNVVRLRRPAGGWQQEHDECEESRRTTPWKHLKPA